jgi:hypothetical protein
VRHREYSGTGEMPDKDPEPALGRKQVHVRKKKNERQENKSGVHAGDLLESTDRKGSRVLAREVIKISVAGEQDRDTGVNEK